MPCTEQDKKGVRNVKKIIISMLSLFVIVTLSGCQEKFDPQTASQESKEILIDFFDSYKDKEVISKNYSEKELNNFFTIDNKQYFTDDFNKNILPKKLEKLTYNAEEDWLKIEKELLFFYILGDIKGIKWEAMNIIDYEVNEEKETVRFFVTSVSPEGSAGYIEMIKENGKWKINNILDI